MDGRLLARYSAWHILTVQMLLGTGVLVPFALPALASQDYAHVTLGGWACLGYTIILSGVVANLLYFRGIDRIGPSRTVLFAYLSSVLGAVLAFVILHEHPTVLEVAGGIIVIASLLFNRPQVRSGRTPLWREVGRIATAVASTRSFWRARGRRGGTRHDASTLR
jgi:drug/metabolite transporter (DMT)-like permease